MPTTLLAASNNASSATQQGSADTGYTVVAHGTWGGGTLTLEYSANGTDFVTSGQTLTADGAMDFTARAGLYWRVTLAGATAGGISATAF